MRLTAALWNDIRLQWRHGFYVAYMLITAGYIALLRGLPDEWLMQAATWITFSDPSVLGFFFIGGLVLLEKGQGIYDPIFVTPLTFREYVFSKVGSLAILSLSSSLVIHLAFFKPTWALLYFAGGVLLTSVLFTLLGMGMAFRCETLNGFFLYALWGGLVFMAPLVGELGWVSRSYFIWMPAGSTLRLLEAPFMPGGHGDHLLQLLLLLVWCAGVYYWVTATARRYLLSQIGGGR